MPAVQVNGQPLDQAYWEKVLTSGPLTEGYRPTLPLWATWTTDTIPQFYLMRDVELMMIHPVVLSSLNFYKSGLYGAEFWGGPQEGNPNGKPISDSPEVSQFVQEHCQRYWDRGVPMVQGGYEYGWIACEPCYTSGAYLEWDYFVQFSPRDVYLLTRNSKPLGVQVKQIYAALGDETKAQGSVDLFFASSNVPAKGIWYAHNPRYSQFYGQSQLLGAWRPWRRLAWKDGAEGNLDLGVYRYLVPMFLIKYPNEDLQVSGTSFPGTSLDSQGNPRKSARDFARMMAEYLKSGASAGLPSEKYPSELGGGDKWAAEMFKVDVNIDGGITYIKHLWDQIRFGVGVPPELIESADVGSGYSGRAIPLESFIMAQQRHADALLLLFVNQILKPLVRWNFGEIQWDVKVRPLLETKRKAQKGESPGAPNTPEMPPNQQSMPGQLPEAQGIPSLVPELPGVPSNGPAGFSLNNDRVRALANLILGDAA
jgi:hypothetical protein